MGFPPSCNFSQHRKLIAEARMLCLIFAIASLNGVRQALTDEIEICCPEAALRVCEGAEEIPSINLESSPCKQRRTSRHCVIKADLYYFYRRKDEHKCKYAQECFRPAEAPCAAVSHSLFELHGGG